MNPKDYAAWSRICRYAAHAPSNNKDIDAESLLKVVGAYRPDVAYVLAQYAIRLEQALRDAEEEIKCLQQKIINPSAGGAKEYRHPKPDETLESKNILTLGRAASSKFN